MAVSQGTDGRNLVFAVDGAGRSGGGEVDFLYPSRAAAEAASPSGDMIMVLHQERVLFYEKALETLAWPALVTADGYKWEPAEGRISPLHWGAAGDAVNDDHPALQAMFNYLVVSSADMLTAWLGGRQWTIDNSGKRYATTRPVMIGNLGTGIGMLYYIHAENLRLKAIQGEYSWATKYGGANEVPSHVLVIAYELNEDASDSITGVYKASFDRLDIDCSFLTGGIYIQNTTQLAFRDCTVEFQGKDTAAFQTSIGDKVSNPRNFRTVNGALMVDNLNVQGYVEETGIGFPAGETQVTMNTIGIGCYTNDARYLSPIISRVTRSIEIDKCGAVQWTNIHPWSREVYVGQNAKNMMFSQCYIDYTRFIVWCNNNTTHSFVGCHLILGGADRGLELRTNQPGETGRCFKFVGCTFKGDSNNINIYTTTDGTPGASWADIREREYQLTGCTFGSNIVPEAYFKAGRHFTIEGGGGHSFFRRNADGFGWTELAGNLLSLGLDRSSAGSAGLSLQWQAGVAAGGTGLLQMTSAGHLVAENQYPAGDIILSTASRPAALRVFASGGHTQIYGSSGVSSAPTALKVGRNGVRSISAAGTINAWGADYAEYHRVVEALWGRVPAGTILGFTSDADGVLTDRWADVRGRCVIKSSSPNLVGNDLWGQEDNLVRLYRIDPVGEQPEIAVIDPPHVPRSRQLFRPDDDAPKQEHLDYESAVVESDRLYRQWEADVETARAAYDSEMGAWQSRAEAMVTAYEAERIRWDRIAKAGFVPVNLAASQSDIGKYLVPAAAADGSITALLKSKSELSLAEYIDSIGWILAIGEDGRPLVEVKSA